MTGRSENKIKSSFKNVVRPGVVIIVVSVFFFYLQLVYPLFSDIIVKFRVHSAKLVSVSKRQDGN